MRASNKPIIEGTGRLGCLALIRGWRGRAQQLIAQDALDPFSKKTPARKGATVQSTGRLGDLPLDDVGVRRNSRKRKMPRSLLLNDAWKASDALEAWLFNDVGEGEAQQLYAQDAFDLSSC